MTHIVNNVEALWPRINRTYKFDSMERKSVPCDAKDPAASYELSFKLDATLPSVRYFSRVLCEDLSSNLMVYPTSSPR